MPDMPTVFFMVKSSFQERDCINRNNEEYQCPNESIFEAVIEKGNLRAAIRCCGDEKCKNVAAELARASILKLLKLRSIHYQKRSLS